jgi:hypothetical protein
MSRALAAPCPRALQGRPRRPRGAACRRESTAPKLIYLRQPRQPDGQPPSGRVIEDMIEPARGQPADPGRGLCRSCPARHRAGDCGRSPAGHPDAHLFKGLRHGGAAGGLCDHQRPIWRWPSTRSATISAWAGSAQAGALAALADQDWLPACRRGPLKAAPGCPPSPAPTACCPCPRPPISSPSTAVATATMPGRTFLTELGKLGVFIRMPGVAPLDRCIRISLGDDRRWMCWKALPQALLAAGRSGSLGRDIGLAGPTAGAAGPGRIGRAKTRRCGATGSCKQKRGRRGRASAAPFHPAEHQHVLERGLGPGQARPAHHRQRIGADIVPAFGPKLVHQPGQGQGKAVLGGLHPTRLFAPLAGRE